MADHDPWERTTVENSPRPFRPYLRFASEKSPAIGMANPTWCEVSMSKHLSFLWDGLTRAQRIPYDNPPRDPREPRRPCSSYWTFQAQCWSQGRWRKEIEGNVIAKGTPRGASIFYQTCIEEIKIVWQDLSPADRRPYKDLYDLRDKAHRVRMKNFRLEVEQEAQAAALTGQALLNARIAARVADRIAQVLDDKIAAASLYVDGLN